MSSGLPPRASTRAVLTAGTREPPPSNSTASSCFTAKLFLSKRSFRGLGTLARKSVAKASKSALYNSKSELLNYDNDNQYILSK